jgi:serine/threonine protein kinase
VPLLPQDKNNLYLVMDFHPGGDLATQLSRWGRLGRDRARFYAAEIVEGVEGLHRAGVIYRDLKPENVLIGADGHIILSDFGLSKEFPVRGSLTRGGSSTPPPGSPTRSHSTTHVAGAGGGKGSGASGHSPHWLSASDDGSAQGSADAFATRSGRSRWADERDVTTTFCGTAEYLAPEVIQGAAYSYEVDWWSFGTMLFEMLTGITPFWADTHADMYVRVLHDELVFPDDRVLDQDTKSILRGLLQRNPMLRMKEPRIKRHPYFSMIEWPHVFHKRYIPPYIPPIDPHDETDTQNFDETFLDMQPVVNGAEDGEPLEETEAQARAAGSAAGNGAASSNGRTAASASTLDGTDAQAGAAAAPTHGKTDSGDGKSLFDGYSFRGRRDSEARSSIISSDPSEAHDGSNAPPTAPSTALSVVESTAASRAPKAAVEPSPAPALAEASDDDDEDDDSAARAAVAALAHLESEASADGSTSNASVSTQPTSTGVSRERLGPSGRATPDGSVDGLPSAGAAGKSRAALSAGGLPAHDTIDETDDEDEDWDMVDLGSAAEGPLKSEINGGKGANLFARGVVDTYRMLRRQESSARSPLPASTSSSSRPFNRLSRRQPSSRRSMARPSSGNLTSGSAVSLDSSSAAVLPPSRSGAAAAAALSGDDEGERDASLLAGADVSSPSSRTPRDSAQAPASAPSLERRSATARPSPSVASSDDVHSQERSSRQRLKKIKRFTT